MAIHIILQVIAVMGAGILAGLLIFKFLEWLFDLKIKEKE